MAIGEEAIVADALEAIGEHVQEKAAQKLVRIKTHDPLHPAAGVVAPCEANGCRRGRRGDGSRWRCGACEL